MFASGILQEDGFGFLDVLDCRGVFTLHLKGTPPSILTTVAPIRYQPHCLEPNPKEPN